MALATERILIAQPVPIGGGAVIAAPFQFLLTGEDNLQLVVWCSKASATVILAGRVLRPDGTMEVFNQTFVPVTNRTANLWRITVGAGYILNLTLLGGAVTTQTGELFARLDLIRGILGATTYLGTIIQGYLTNRQGLSFPGSPIQLSIDGPGALHAVVGTKPAAGGNISETIPTGARWHLLAVALQLVTSATVGLRNVILRVQRGGTLLYAFLAATAENPSDSISYFYATGIQAMGVTIGVYSAEMLATDLPLLAGDVIDTFTYNLAAGDQFDNPVFTVREWLEPT